MWRMTSTPKTYRLTNRLATEWANMPTAHTDRPLSQARVDAYKSMYEAGKMRPVSWARVACEETGVTYRVNGKHTSTMFAGVDLSKSEQHVVIEDYACETLSDVAELYATFDSRVQARTVHDINRSFAAVVPELSAVDLKALNLFVAATSWWLTPAQPYVGSAADRATRMITHKDLCLWMLGIVYKEGVNAKHLCRAAVVGAMFATYEKSTSKATEFWTLVRDETGATPDTPDRRLAKFLITTVVRSSSGSRSPTSKAGRPSLTQREFYVKSIHAWNAWRGGGRTELKYHPNAKLPSAR